MISFNYQNNNAGNAMNVYRHLTTTKTDKELIIMDDQLLPKSNPNCQALRIKLTQGKHALVDAEDYEYLNQWKWLADNKKNTYYAARNVRLGVHGVWRLVYMHRVILGPPKNKKVDHKDGNGLNNQRYNIRVCTHKQNMQNQTPQTGRSSKFKGVRKRKDSKKWAAYIKKNKKQISLGCFASEIDAAIAYNKKATELFGEFARINEIIL